VIYLILSSIKRCRIPNLVLNVDFAKKLNVKHTLISRIVSVGQKPLTDFRLDSGSPSTQFSDDLYLAFILYDKSN